MTDDNTQSNKTEEEMFAALDEETQLGLEEVIKENPDLLRETLADLGYVTETNEQLIRNEEAATIADREERIADVVENMGNPRTASEITELIVTEYPDIVDEFQSAKHRSWVSTQLNELVDKEIIGRFKDGHEIRFTADPAEAVRHWALHNDQFVESLDRSDVKSISESTGMPPRSVRKAIDAISA